MGWVDAFAYRHPVDVFREYAALSGTENNGSRDFDISALSGIMQRDYDALQPFQWPLVKGAQPGQRRFLPTGNSSRQTGVHALLPHRGGHQPHQQMRPAHWW